MLFDGSAFTRDTQRGLELSLSLGVEACGNRTIDDRDAAAYIAAVEAAKGSPVTVTQSRAIFDFIKAEKLAARWDFAGRIYLPIWGVASANAIDMVSRGSGSWVGGVTHASGYAQGDGSSGYFYTGSTLASAGATATSQLAFALVTTTSTLSGYRTLINAWSGLSFTTPGIWIITALNGGQMRMDSVSLTEFVSPYVGVLTNSRTSSTSWHGRTRRSSGVTGIFTGASTSVSGLATGNVYVMATKGSGATVEHYSDARIGCFGFRSGLSTAETDRYTLNLKTLWETCTGLALP